LTISSQAHENNPMVPFATSQPAEPMLVFDPFEDCGITFPQIGTSTMRQERALKVVLVVVGLLFCAGVYPLILMMKQDPRSR
jgi:hypothetical protein